MKAFGATGRREAYSTSFLHFPNACLSAAISSASMFTFCSSMANRSFTDPATAKGAVAAVAGEFTACAGASPKKQCMNRLFLHARLTGKLLHKRPELRARQASPCILPLRQCSKTGTSAR